MHPCAVLEDGLRPGPLIPAHWQKVPGLSCARSTHSDAPDGARGQHCHGEMRLDEGSGERTRTRGMTPESIREQHTGGRTMSLSALPPANHFPDQPDQEYGWFYGVR